jgi:hypothetical protein
MRACLEITLPSGHVARIWDDDYHDPAVSLLIQALTNARNENERLRRQLAERSDGGAA